MCTLAPNSRPPCSKRGSQLGQKRKVGSQLKRFSRDSQESLEVQKALFLLICLLFLFALTLVCLFVADLLVVNTAFCWLRLSVGSQLKRFSRVEVKRLLKYKQKLCWLICLLFLFVLTPVCLLFADLLVVNTVFCCLFLCFFCLCWLWFAYLLLICWLSILLFVD